MQFNILYATYYLPLNNNTNAKTIIFSIILTISLAKRKKKKNKNPRVQTLELCLFLFRIFIYLKRKKLVSLQYYILTTTKNSENVAYAFETFHFVTL